MAVAFLQYQKSENKKNFYHVALFTRLTLDVDALW